MPASPAVDRRTQDRRMRTLMRQLVDAGEALKLAVDADSGPLKISIEEKRRRAERWEAALENLRGAQ